MESFFITGPTKLRGQIHISCAKNSCLPLLAATLLTPHVLSLEGLPNLKDIGSMITLLKELGVKVEKNEAKDQTTFDASGVDKQEAIYDIVRTMRASILVLGPLLARFKRAKVSMPGGCAIGTRPIDIHLEGLKQMGATMSLKGGYAELEAPEGLKGAEITLPFPSVTATENLLMAAVLAEGTTILNNVALEPEIEDLAFFLSLMGVEIMGIGTNKLTILGVKELRPLTQSYRPIPDRIEAGTFLIAGIMTNSEITINSCRPLHMKALLSTLEKMGAKLEIKESSITVLKREDNEHLVGIEVDTAPHPAFPTDMQAQLMALCCFIKDGHSMIVENIFENRFMHVSELKRLGAQITLKGKAAVIAGKHASELTAAPIMCTDLRASAALVLAAMASEGTTEVRRIYHIDRGYENIDQKLCKLGAKIERASGSSV